MLFSMKLSFLVRRVEATPALAAKFSSLGKNQFVYRVYAQIVFLLPDGSESFPITGIIDTGASFSLFPQRILDEFPGVRTEDHTLWGIVDAPECHVHAKLAVVNIRLVDKDSTKSGSLSIVGAFSSNDKIPVLIGMKDLLATFHSCIDPSRGVFELNLPDK